MRYEDTIFSYRVLLLDIHQKEDAPGSVEVRVLQLYVLKKVGRME